MINKEYYLGLRDRYLPEILKLIFVLESPPVSGKYFYDETGKTSEPLFSEMMKLLKFRPQSKRHGLLLFQSKGCFLVDATYNPVNSLDGPERNKTILNDYDNLLSDLKKTCAGRLVPIVLVKANICRILEHRLLGEGFNVKNRGVIVPFPSTGQQKRFHLEMARIKQMW